METRGKATSALNAAGGAVRNIDPECISKAITASYGGEFAVSDLVNDVVNILNMRIVAVDNPPINLREAGAKLAEVQKAAETLLDKMNSADLGDLLAEIAFTPTSIGSPNDVYRWITRLAKMDHHFSRYSPAKEYGGTLRALARTLKAHNLPVTVSEASNFMRLLETLETNFPKLIFAEGRAPQGRVKLVGRAIKDG